MIHELMNLTSNENRVKILGILYNTKKTYNILQLSKKLGIGYKSTYNHIKILESAHAVKCDTKINNKGKNVFVALNPSEELNFIIELRGLLSKRGKIKLT